MCYSTEYAGSIGTLVDQNTCTINADRDVLKLIAMSNENAKTILYKVDYCRPDWYGPVVV